jgi:hypothetical protein
MAKVLAAVKPARAWQGSEFVFIKQIKWVHRRNPGRERGARGQHAPPGTLLSSVDGFRGGVIFFSLQPMVYTLHVQ